MRVAAGTAATAGAPPAVASSGSRGVLTRRVSQLALDHAGRRRHLQERVLGVDVAAARPDLGAREDPGPAPPLDVRQAGQLDARAGFRSRARDRRAAEEAHAAAPEAQEAGVARAHAAPGATGPVEEL